MITKITGKLLAVADDVLTLASAPFEYEVLIPEFARRQLQTRARPARSACTRSTTWKATRCRAG